MWLKGVKTIKYKKLEIDVACRLEFLFMVHSYVFLQPN